MKSGRTASHYILTAATALIISFTACGDGMKILFQNDSSDKEITSFVFLADNNLLLTSDAAGIIINTAITVYVPIGTDITALIPSIEFNGESLSPGNGQPQDFSQPVMYTVTAEDGTVLDYTATVTPAPKIISITSTTLSGYYNAGREINITVTFCSTVTLNGTLDVVLNTGAMVAVTASSEGTVFSGIYTVTDGENTADLDATGITLVSGTAREASGIDAIINLPEETIADASDIVVDTYPPQAIITSPAYPLTNISPINLTITFNEEVAGFTADDISVANGAKGGSFDATNAPVYTETVNPGNGNVVVNINSAVAFDLAGNYNTASSPLTVKFDGTSPSVVISGPSATTGTFTTTFTFDEDVTGFTIDDITFSAGAGTKSNFNAVSASVYTAQINVSADVSVNVAAGVASDLAGNLNNDAPATLDVTYSAGNPTVMITSVEGNPTNASTIHLTITFNEDVTGFTLAGINVGNGVASNLQPAAGPEDIYTAEVAPSGQGTVSVTVQAGAAQDGEAYPNLEGSFSTVFDSVNPQPTITTSEPDPTGSKPFSATLTFNELVNADAIHTDEFTVTNCSITGITAQNPVAGYEDTFIIVVNPVTDGTVTVYLNAGATTDKAGNSNDSNIGAPLSIVYDSTPGQQLLTLRPESNGFWSGITENSCGEGLTTSYKCIDDNPADDNTFVFLRQSIGGTQTTDLNIQNHTTETGTINKVVINFRIEDYWVSGSSDINPYAQITTYGPQQTPPAKNQWYAYAYEWITKPAGGAWTWNDVDLLALSLVLYTAYGYPPPADYQMRCSEIWVDVYYTP